MKGACLLFYECDMDVSKNSGFPKSSIKKIGFSIIFTIHFGVLYPYFWKHPYGLSVYHDPKAFFIWWQHDFPGFFLLDSDVKDDSIPIQQPPS